MSKLDKIYMTLIVKFSLTSQPTSAVRLPVLTCLCRRCPWCWSKWFATMQYDSTVFFFWRLCECINTDRSHWECGRLFAQNKRWIVWLKHSRICWHAVLDKHREKLKTFSSCFKIIFLDHFKAAKKHIPHSLFIVGFSFKYCKFSKSLNTCRVWCFVVCF